MKLFTRWMIALLLLAILLAPQAARAQDGSGDKFVLGGTYVLSAGQTLPGDLYVLGGFARLEPGSRVAGDALLMGGTLSSAGEISGNVMAAGGLVTLESGALVVGDVHLAGGQLDRQPGVSIQGEINQAGQDTLPILPPGDVRSGRLQAAFNPVLSLLWIFLRSFLWAALAVVIVLFAPQRVELAGRAVGSQPIITAGLGLLAVVAVPLVLLVVAITIIGIPISLLGFAVLAIAWALGIIAVGAELGRRLELALRQDWAPPVTAAIGVFGLTFLINAINAAVDCAGWIAPALAGILGLGALLLTRLGSQPYPPPAEQSIVPAPQELLSPGDDFVD